MDVRLEEDHGKDPGLAEDRLLSELAALYPPKESLKRWLGNNPTLKCLTFFVLIFLEARRAENNGQINYTIEPKTIISLASYEL